MNNIQTKVQIAGKTFLADNLLANSDNTMIILARDAEQVIILLDRILAT